MWRTLRTTNECGGEDETHDVLPPPLKIPARGQKRREKTRSPSSPSVSTNPHTHTRKIQKKNTIQRTPTRKRQAGLAEARVCGVRARRLGRHGRFRIIRRGEPTSEPRHARVGVLHVEGQRPQPASQGTAGGLFRRRARRGGGLERRAVESRGVVRVIRHQRRAGERSRGRKYIRHLSLSPFTHPRIHSSSAFTRQTLSSTFSPPLCCLTRATVCVCV